MTTHCSDSIREPVLAAIAAAAGAETAVRMDYRVFAIAPVSAEVEAEAMARDVLIAAHNNSYPMPEKSDAHT